MNLPPKMYNQGSIPPTWLSSQPPSYPVKLYPPVLQNTIRALHEDTQIPIEMIGSVVLAAASLACQSLVEVIPPYTNMPEQCSLYLLTVAESGEGKTTINKQVMKPFYDFASEMKLAYEAKLSDYKREYKIWKIRQQALDGNLRQAIRKGYEGEEEEKYIKKHAEKEPKKPVRPNVIYEDTTLRALIEGLSEYPEAGFISDEAITFFKSHVKNNPGLLNKAWDGEAYDFRRADGEIYEVTPCLTFSLMVQPGVFMDYLKKYGDIARSSGFLSRFLFARVNSTIGYRSASVEHGKSVEAMDIFYAKITTLLAQHKNRFYDNLTEKKILTLTDEAKMLWKNKRIETEQKIASGHEWEHIRDVVSKSGANALRIAAILQYVHDESQDSISEAVLKNSYDIMDWYLNQANVLFYPMSEQYQFELDVRELFSWIKNRLIQNNGVPFLKNDLEKYGPHRLRRTDKLIPVLNQLISQKVIGIVQSYPGTALYISPQSNGYFTPLPTILPNQRFNIVQSWANTIGRLETVVLPD